MTSSPTAQRPLRVGIVGFGWMGQVHARAYTRLASTIWTFRSGPS